MSTQTSAIARDLNGNPLRAQGDLAGINDRRYPGVWKIIKVNPTTYKLLPAAADPATASRSQYLNASHELVTGPPDGPAAVPARDRMHAGALVMWDSRKAETGWPYVVIKDEGEAVMIAMLGGDQGMRYKARPANLTPVTLTTRMAVAIRDAVQP